MEELIDQQLEDLIAGKFSFQELAEVQDSLINQYRASHDYANNILGRQLLFTLLDLPEDGNVAAKINAVTAADVQRVAAELKLQATYLLSGEK